jgi:hypothetical protein
MLTKENVQTAISSIKGTYDTLIATHGPDTDNYGISVITGKMGKYIDSLDDMIKNQNS